MVDESPNSDENSNDFGIYDFLDDHYKIFTIIGIFIAITVFCLNLMLTISQSNQPGLETVRNTLNLTSTITRNSPEIPLLSGTVNLFFGRPVSAIYFAAFISVLIVIFLLILVIRVYLRTYKNQISIFIIFVLGLCEMLIIFTVWLFSDAVILILFIAWSLFIGLLWARMKYNIGRLLDFYREDYQHGLIGCIVLVFIILTLADLYGTLFQQVSGPNLLALLIFLFTFVGISSGCFLLSYSLLKPFLTKIKPSWMKFIDGMKKAD